MDERSENAIGTIIVDRAIAVHRVLGPGLFESVYEACLTHELLKLSLRVERQLAIPITYGELQFEEGFRADMVVEGCVLIELKSVEKLSDVHKKQLLTYLRLGGYKLGFLLNFNHATLKEGLVRIVNGLPS